MKPFKFGSRSKKNLKNVHPTLVKLCEHTLELSDNDFGITCGSRSIDEQKLLVKNGKSWTMKSYHLIQDDGYSHAIDFMAYDKQGNVTWDMKYYEDIAFAFYRSADKMNIRITWGGTWKTKDGPHIQIEHV